MVSFDKQKFRILKQSEFLVFSYVVANFKIPFKKSLQPKVTKKFSHVWHRSFILSLTFRLPGIDFCV